MNRYKKILLFSLFLGVILAYFFYRDINSEVKAINKKEEVIYVFQSGVYKEYNNAMNHIRDINMGVIYHDKEYYRVIVGITHNPLNKDKLINYFKSNNIDYYIKEMKVNKSVLNDLKGYEEVLNKTSKDAIINTINNRMLEIFISYLN